MIFVSGNGKLFPYKYKSTKFSACKNKHQTTKIWQIFIKTVFLCYIDQEK